MVVDAFWEVLHLRPRPLQRLIRPIPHLLNNLPSFLHSPHKPHGTPRPNRRPPLPLLPRVPLMRRPLSLLLLLQTTRHRHSCLYRPVLVHLLQPIPFQLSPPRHFHLFRNFLTTHLGQLTMKSPLGKPILLRQHLLQLLLHHPSSCLPPAPVPTRSQSCDTLVMKTKNITTVISCPVTIIWKWTNLMHQLTVLQTVSSISHRKVYHIFRCGLSATRSAGTVQSTSSRNELCARYVISSGYFHLRKG